MSVYDRLGDKVPPSYAPKQGRSWRGGRGEPRRSRGVRGGGHWRGGVNPRTRIDGDEGSQQHYDNFQRGNQRFPHRGRGKKRFSPYERQQYQGGQEDEFFEDVVGEEDETQPKGDIFSRLGNREEGSTFQDPLDDGYTEGQGADSWFKVTVPGAADDTDEWMSRIRSEIGIPLEEHNLHVLGNKMMFFVNDSNVASALRGIDGKIQSQSGPLRVRVNPSNPPQPPRGGRSRGTSNFQRGSPPFRGGTPRLSSGGFDGEITMKDVSSMRDTLKQSLGTRYVPAEKSLNLSDMFNDATASSSGMKVIMTKANFVEVIIQLIAEFCPDLVTLNLSSNRIQYLSMYSELSKAAPNLQAVDLSKNNIRHLNELDHIAGCMQLKYLQLEGNPGVDHFRDFSSLAQDVRRRFPNLQNLNGQEMAKPVKFGVPDSSSLPPPLPPVQGNYVISEEVQTVVTQFVKAYYEIYDSANRDNLLSAYHDTAFFSLSVRQTDRSGGGPVGHPVNSYLPVSRNFLRLPDAAKRNALIQGGRVDIVKALKSLPRTFHILSSFTVDVLTASSTLTCFTLIGAFAEVSSSSSVLSEYDVRNVPMRCFSRTFAVIPIPNGFIITNDQMTIWNPSPALDKKFRQELVQQHRHQQQQKQQQQLLEAPAVSFSNPMGGHLGSGSTLLMGQQSALSPSHALAQHPRLAGLSEEQKVLVLKLLQSTGMNVQYSLTCLSQNSFDYEKSLESFQILKKTIPQGHEMFTRDY